MPRPVTRTATLPVSVADAILDAFGTQWVGWKQLNSVRDLELDGVTPSTFYRALRGQTIAPYQAAAITAAWDARRVLPVEVSDAVSP